MTPHAFLKNRISSRIRIYMRKGFIPLIRTDVLMTKTEGRKSRDTVPLMNNKVALDILWIGKHMINAFRLVAAV
jgi:hypothetical protein